MKIKVTCNNCGNTLYRFLCEVKNGNNFYCNGICLAEHTKKKGRTMAKYTCLNCGKEREVLAWRVKYLKFCSAKCAATYNKENKVIKSYFEKGCKAYNEGKTNVELYGEEKAAELSRINSESNIGRIPWSKGKTFSKEHIAKMVRTKMENDSYKWSEEQKIKQSCFLRGITREEWGGFTSSERQQAWNSKENNEWQKAVFERDNYICQECGDHNYKGRGKTIRIEAHHIKEWANYPELRYDVDNGITLCKKCHVKKNKGCKTKFKEVA